LGEVRRRPPVVPVGTIRSWAGCASATTVAVTRSGHVCPGSSHPPARQGDWLDKGKPGVTRGRKATGLGAIAMPVSRVAEARNDAILEWDPLGSGLHDTSAR